jgi:GRAM domain
VILRTKDIVKVSKEKTALVIPNAIQITTNDDKSYFFASFATRDKTFLILDRVRKCATEDQVKVLT